MVSFRRDMPERGRRFPTQREEAEERGELRRGFPQRPPSEAYYPQERRPEENRHWSDYLPTVYRKTAYDDWDVIFSVFVPKGAAPAREGPRIPPQTAPRGGPQAGPRSAPEVQAQRATRAPGQPPGVDASDWLDLKRIWSAIAAVKADPRFTPGRQTPIVKITNPTRSEDELAEQLIRFFRIPPEEVRQYTAQTIWTQLLNPFLDELAYAINYGKPREVPGRVLFQKGSDGCYWLWYVE